MILIEAPESNFKAYMPSDLSECDARQYIEMCGLIFQLITGQITYEELKVHAVYRMLNMVPEKKKPTLNQETQDKEDLNKFGNIHRLSEKIESFFDTAPEGQKIIKTDFLHNPIPKFRPTWQTLYGPTDQFMNIKVEEYNDALRIFLQFNATGEIELLYDFAAILYRPKKIGHFFLKHLGNYDGDLRQQYNPNHVEKRAQMLRYAPFGFIYGVYLLFAAFQKFLPTAKIPWAGKELDLAILFQREDNEHIQALDLPDIGLDSVIFSIAESGAFGTKEQFEKKTGIWMMWVHMYELRRKDLELKKQQENDTSK